LRSRVRGRFQYDVGPALNAFRVLSLRDTVYDRWDVPHTPASILRRRSSFQEALLLFLEVDLVPREAVDESREAHCMHALGVVEMDDEPGGP
jgi:hypothetical protein